jgi:hypothetical protein
VLVSVIVSVVQILGGRLTPLLPLHQAAADPVEEVFEQVPGRAQRVQRGDAFQQPGQRLVVLPGRQPGRLARGRPSTRSSSPAGSGCRPSRTAVASASSCSTTSRGGASSPRIASTTRPGTNTDTLDVAAWENTSAGPGPAASAATSAAAAIQCAAATHAAAGSTLVNSRGQPRGCSASSRSAATTCTGEASTRSGATARTARPDSSPRSAAATASISRPASADTASVSAGSPTCRSTRPRTRAPTR